MTFFQFRRENEDLGFVSFELFDDECPKATYNFRELCKGTRGIGTLGKLLSYKGTRIFRVIPGFLIQGGDVVNNDGTSGESIYGPLFDDEDAFQAVRSVEDEEDLPYKTHDLPGLLCTATLGLPNTNSSQFYITLGACPWQDGRDTIFGRVVSGMKTLAKIQQMGSSTGECKNNLIISNCGELPSVRIMPSMPIEAWDGDKPDDKQT